MLNMISPLDSERANASFSVDALRKLVAGRRPETSAKFKPLFSGPDFDSSMDHYLSYTELFEAQLRRATKAVALIRDNPKMMLAHQAQKVQMADMFDTGSMGIHFIAFLPFLRTQANKEQKAAWLDGALNARYFGAYAQTELGHGSNVRGLETTATFDAETDEFVIHSPTLSSMKWWPTGMYACTHGVVFAQLIIKGKSQGVFGFFVQFRDEHGELMPGVEVGEIGPKLTPGETNIGYAKFDHVRVPRFNMFSKHASVGRDGTFNAAPPQLSKFKYVGMMTIRVNLVGGAGRACAKAAAIAIRYSAVRRQGFKDSRAADADAALAAGEHAILDYKVQMYRLFKCLGASFLMMWTGRNIVNKLKQLVDSVDEGDIKAAEVMPALHADVAGLKAVCTTWAANMVEDARRCCGGQGFLRSSGLADLSTQYVGVVTAEGEAVILALQTARFLIKSVAAARRGESVAGSVAYVSSSPLGPQQFPWQGTDATARTALLVSLLRDRARAIAHDLADDFDAATNSGLSFDAALNSVAVLGWRATEAHCMYVMAANAAEALPTMVKGANERAVIERLLHLNLLMAIQEAGGDFAGTLDRAQLRAAHAATQKTLDELRPDAVPLTDALGFTDFQLHSTIGRADGHVYEAIYEEARKSPLNGKKMVGWDALRPVLDIDFVKEGHKWQRHVAEAKL